MILSSKGDEGPRLIRCTAVFTASAQKLFGSPECNRMLLARSVIVLFIRSATPFCCGVLGTVNSLLIPWLSQNCLNSTDRYSPPLSDRSKNDLIIERFSIKINSPTHNLPLLYDSTLIAEIGSCTAAQYLFWFKLMEEYNFYHNSDPGGVQGHNVLS